MEDQDAALRDYDAIIKMDPKDATNYVSRAMVYLQTEQNDLALKDLNTVVELDPSNGVGYALRAPLRLSKGDFQGSIDDSVMAMALGAAEWVSN